MARPNLNIASALNGMDIVMSATKERSDLSVAAKSLSAETIVMLEDLIKAVCRSDELGDDDFEALFGEVDSIDCGLEAAELIAHRSSIDNIPVLLEFFRRLDEMDMDDRLAAAGPEIVGRFGPDAAPPFMECVIGADLGETPKSVIIDGVQIIGDNHPSVQQSLAPLIVQGLRQARKLTPPINSQLMMLAIDWRLVEAAEPIERAFADNQIDCGMAGGWEEVRKMLHVEGLGLPMPSKPVNSMADFRRNVGVGAFSNQPLFMLGEVQEEACQAYLETACKAFARSKEGTTSIGEGGFPGYVHQFLDLGLNYLRVNVESMTAAHATELLLEIFPRKVSMDADETDAAIDELVGFWKFCDRVHNIEHAASIARKVDNLRRQFHREMNTPENFGMAKGFVMAGVQAGFDMNTQDGLTAFMHAFNQSQLASRGISEPASNPSRVDRPAQSPRSEKPSTNVKKKKSRAKRKKRKKR